MSRDSFYLTTPIYYVNSVPHLGTAYTTIAADALARYRRMTGRDVFFLTGLDEHGQKVAQAAEEHGMSPQEWVDSIAPKFMEAWQMLGISNDGFVRTTEERHKRGVQAFWQELHDRGFLHKGSYEGWYCVPDETYYAEEQLAEGKCPGCGRDVEFIREENWFFKLSEFGDKLLAFYEEREAAGRPFIQPETRRNEVVSFVEGGLRDLSISRTNFTWGVPLPFDEGHVTYVWIDALLNYITAVGYGDPDKAEEFALRWPAQYHFVGKDIIRFHCVIWPAMLMAAGVALPETVFAHGFLLTKGEKMSKSKGNAVSPADLVDRFGVDAYRYYFLRDVQFGSDGLISMESMVQRYNGDLANDWGNLCSRLFNMVGKYFDGVVPEPPAGKPTDADATLKAIAGCLPEKYEDAMSRLDYTCALEAVWDLVKETNRYIENEAPWNLAKAE
ncbi:MAG: methionine--tRNA ligase, partial [Actinomycetota bacterium]|nr:methionine--tRNA ligase [Actinomycetota bacterium]